MVTDEIRSFEEGKRQTIAAGFAKQCTWTQWENAEQRKLTWSSLQKMEPLRISFLLRSTYDLLPTPTNLKQWGMTQDDICLDCGKSRATLEHILATCSNSLQKYTWRHNQVLKVLSEATKTQCENISLINTTIDEDVRFVREGTQPSAKKPKGVRAKLLEDDSDWQALIDLEERLVFPTHITITNLRPDIIIWSDRSKIVLIVELTVPWERNMEVANERKMTKYEVLKTECEDNGWRCCVFPIEVGCRGYIARSTMGYLRGIGLSRKQQRETTRALETAAETASSWIWQTSRKPNRPR